MANDNPRITVDPAKMGGTPCIRGLRIPVKTIVRAVAHGMSHAEILDAYPDLVEEDIQAALAHAAPEPAHEAPSVAPTDLTIPIAVLELERVLTAAIDAAAIAAGRVTVDLVVARTAVSHVRDSAHVVLSRVEGWKRE